MRPLASSAYQSVCAFRSALPSASKYDRTTVLVSEAGAVAWLVVMVCPQVRGRGYRTRRSRDVQARLTWDRAGLRGWPTAGSNRHQHQPQRGGASDSASDNPESPRTYNLVRAGTGWPEVGGVAAEANSAAAGRADSNKCTRGGGEGPRSSTPVNG